MLQVTAVEEMRKAVGRFGITGKTQTQPMAQLSDGLRSRVVFAWLVRAAVYCRGERRGCTHASLRC